jgi:hypothetical protein
MITSERNRITCTAFVAMEIFILRTYPTDTTSLAVIDILLGTVIIPQLTYIAKVIREKNSTECAGIGCTLA